MRKPKRIKSKQLVLCGMLTAAAMVLSYVEFLFPLSFLGAGVKLGLANIVTLYALYALGAFPALVILLVRIFLSSLMFNGMSACVYSLSGGLLAFFLMLLCKKSKLFSCFGVGIAGGVSHNIGQLAVASFMLGRVMITYLPILLLFGTAAGIFVGAASAGVIKKLQKFTRKTELLEER